MFFGDIPIWLINTALWCMVATPFVVAAAVIYLARQQHFLRGLVCYGLREIRDAASTSPEPRAHTNAEIEAMPHGIKRATATTETILAGAEKRQRRGISLSQFGR